MEAAPVTISEGQPMNCVQIGALPERGPRRLRPQRNGVLRTHRGLPGVDLDRRAGFVERSPTSIVTRILRGDEARGRLHRPQPRPRRAPSSRNGSCCHSG